MTLPSSPVDVMNLRSQDAAVFNAVWSAFFLNESGADGLPARACTRHRPSYAGDWTPLGGGPAKKKEQAAKRLAGFSGAGEQKLQQVPQHVLLLSGAYGWRAGAATGPVRESRRAGLPVGRSVVTPLAGTRNRTHTADFGRRRDAGRRHRGRGNEVRLRGRQKKASSSGSY